jgi:hypothetical protein
MMEFIDVVDALVALVAVPDDQLLTSDPTDPTDPTDLGTLVAHPAIPVTVVGV